VRATSNPVENPPVAFAQIDVVPRVTTGETHKWRSKILVFSVNGLFQQYLPQADIVRDIRWSKLTTEKLG
jgi:hypothetical protein